MALVDNLISYWKLDEFSGGASDSLGINTLSNVGIATYNVAKIKNGVNLASVSSQYLSITDASQVGLDLSSDFSFSSWINATTFPAADENDILSKDNVNVSRSYAFYVDNASKINAVVFGAGGNGQRNVKTNLAQISTGTTYHVALTYSLSGNSFVVYVNGSSVAVTLSNTGITSITNSTADFIIGARKNSGTAEKFWNGWIDEVGIWSKVLSTAEITLLYNGGVGLSFPFGGNNNTLTNAG